jgi:hypothetical protein
MDPHSCSMTLEQQQMMMHQMQNRDSRQDSPIFLMRTKHPEEDATMGKPEDNDDGDDSMRGDDGGDYLEYKQEVHCHAFSSNGRSEASGAVNRNEGLHHPEVASFLRDQAGFIISPRKRTALFSSYPLAHQSGSTTLSRADGEDASPLNAVEVALSVVEEPVSLAPRFSQIQEEPQDRGRGSGALDFNGHFLSSSPSFRNPHESTNGNIQGSHGRVLEPGSPTSTTARDFLREVPCPSIPIQSTGSNCSTLGSSVIQSGRSFSMDQSDSSNFTRVRHSSQLLLIRPNGEDKSNSARRPSSSTGRALCRSFAWSHDSQDDLRITKRARMRSGSVNGFSPPSQQPYNLFARSSHASQQRQQLQDGLQESSSQFLEDHDDEHRDDPSFSPTMVHWEEKVIDGDELLARAAQHDQRGHHHQQQNQQYFLGFASGQELGAPGALPPPIAPAASASQYSFDSGS